MIKSIDKSSVHRITSGQVLVDLQTAVKELVENSLDAGATNIEVKLKDCGVKSFEVIDNGSGIAPEDFDFVAMKHCTSKLSTFEDLSAVQTFGFRGEALSSLCALSERVTITTTTAKEAPMGTVLELDRFGKVTNSETIRQRGTTVYVEGFFKPLAVRRKELERNSKREFGKVLNLLNAYALVPCTKENRGVRLSVVHQQEGGRKSVQLRTDGKPSLGASISSLWGPKQLESLTGLSLDLDVIPEKTVLRRQGDLGHGRSTKVQVRGLISKFSFNDGRTGSDRQFFFINGRPCNPSKIQKAFNEVYRTFNVNQSPFIVADFILPTDSCDINVSPDKRTILLHSENALVSSLKDALEKTFSSSRSTFNVQPIQTQKSALKNAPVAAHSSPSNSSAVDSQEVVTKVTEASDGAEDMDDGITRKSPTPVLMTPPDLFPDKRSEQSSRYINPRPYPYTPQPGSRTRSPSAEAASSGLTSVSPPVPASVKPAARPIQMVLSTADASWAMHPTSGEPAPKRRKLEPGKGANPRMALRSKLVAFYAIGTPNARVQGRSDEVVGVMDDETADDVETDGEDVDELIDEELEDAGNVSRADPMDEDTEVSVSSARKSVSDGTVEGMMDEDPLFLPEPDELEPVSEGSVSTSVRIKAEEEHVELDADSALELSAERVENLHALSADTGDDAASSASIPAISGSADGPGRVVPVEIMHTPDENPDMQMSFDFERVKLAWSSFPAIPSTSTGNGSSKKAGAVMVDESAGILNVDEASAEHELSRVLDMEDFASMEVLGQFNLGFIIARLRTQKKSAQGGSGETPEDEKIGSTTDLTELDDLFIIDQHAADEKYNFETLQQTTRIESQKLLRPRPLELTAADELIAIENIDILKSNGFEISVDEDAEPSRGRVKLVAQPVSGSTNFDMKDLEELLHLMQDRSPGQKMEECHDRHGAEQSTDDHGGTTYERYGPAVELSTWTTDNEASSEFGQDDWVKRAR
ncbi:hypothetical protein M0805_000463 [Coniferiporia weirii]|nr:hypothetical protein M0805_000463 [Coniferiporia weirii]